MSPRLLAQPGVGTLTATKLLGETAGVARFRFAAAFAMHAGAGTIRVWTGNRERRRLNRGGSWQLNAALHRVAVIRMRVHQLARDLLQRRRQDYRDTKARALRLLKRHLSDIVFSRSARTNSRETPTYSSRPLY